MYTPRANAETRIPVMQQLIRDEPLAVLVTLGAGGLLATHLPLVLAEAGDGFGVLRGHVARANGQWRELETPGPDALAIFSGPQHYIRPSWYPGKVEHGEEVPTWNYVVVHAYGPLRVVQDEAWLMAHLEQLTGESEAGRAVAGTGAGTGAWKVSDAPAEFIRGELRGIVGLEMPVRRMEGKWKVSQNRTERDRQGVVDGLAGLETPAAEAMRRLVVERS